MTKRLCSGPRSPLLPVPYFVGFLAAAITKPSPQGSNTWNPADCNLFFKDCTGVGTLLFVGSVLSFGADELAFSGVGFGV